MIKFYKKLFKKSENKKVGVLKETPKMVYSPLDADDFNKVVEEAEIVIVDFTAAWCGPCKMISPYFEQLYNEHKDKQRIKFIKVDVDELEDVSINAGVSAMPSFFVYKNGIIVDQLIGANKEKLEALVNKYTMM